MTRFLPDAWLIAPWLIQVHRCLALAHTYMLSHSSGQVPLRVNDNAWLLPWARGGLGMITVEQFAAHRVEPNVSCSPPVDAVLDAHQPFAQAEW